MLRVTVPRHAYVKTFRIGSKHRKHMAYAPVEFLYRIPDKNRGPGPVLMKYWWTLGCFPTGLETPFRIHEFRQTYLQEHLPEDVEAWLAATVVDPVDVIVPSMREFVRALDAVPSPEQGLLYHRADLTGVQEAAAPLQRAMREFDVEVPTVAVRAVAQSSRLRRHVMDAVHEYAEEVAEFASTPHRRWARYELQAAADGGQQAEGSSSSPGPAGSILSASDADAAPTVTDGVAPPPAAAGPLPEGLTAAGAGAVGHSMDAPPSTAPDERLLVEAMTVLAAGAQRVKRNDLAARLLSDAFRFIHDDDAAGATHANLSSVLNAQGDHKEALTHAREAVLRSRDPRGYANWAVSVALQDDFETAGQVLADGLVAQPGSPTLLAAQRRFHEATAGRTAIPADVRGKRVSARGAYQRGVERKHGKAFDNEFDVVLFNGRRVAAQLDQTNPGLGTVFRRAGEFNTQAITSTNVDA